MVTKRKFAKRTKRKPRLVGTTPKMMSTLETRKRILGVDTRVFWFKFNNYIKTALTPNMHHTWKITDLIDPTINPVAGSFWKLCTLYDQYKVLGLKLRMMPANILTATMTRGNTASWIDQRDDPPVLIPMTIGQVIGNNNCRLINSNRPYSTAIWRPKGKPIWGATKHITTTDQFRDPWTGVINVMVEGATENPETPTAGWPKTLWYCSSQFKVVFRARVND